MERLLITNKEKWYKEFWYYVLDKNNGIKEEHVPCLEHKLLYPIPFTKNSMRLEGIRIKYSVCIR